MEYDYNSNKITTKAGKMIIIPNTENDILNYLYERKGTVCTAEEISNYLYGDYDGVKTVKVFVTRLRNRIGKTIKIRTIYKKGYIID